jgi:hypothetical protein
LASANSCTVKKVIQAMPEFSIEIEEWWTTKNITSRWWP